MEKETVFAVRVVKGFSSFFVHVHKSPSFQEEKETFSFAGRTSLLGGGEGPFLRSCIEELISLSGDLLLRERWNLL